VECADERNEHEDIYAQYFDDEETEMHDKPVQNEHYEQHASWENRHRPSDNVIANFRNS
jgi:hypothetical protein